MRKRQLTSILWLAGGLLFAGGLVGGAIYLVRNDRIAFLLPEDINEAQLGFEGAWAEAEAYGLHELHEPPPSPPIPSDQNAVDLLINLEKPRDMISHEQWRHIFPATLASQPDQTKLSDLDEFKEEMEVIQQATELNHFYADPSLYTSAELARMLTVLRDYAGLFVRRATLKVRMGDEANAINDCITASRIPNLLTSEPDTMAFLSRSVLFSYVPRHLQFEGHEYRDPEQLARLRRTIESEMEHTPLKPMLRGVMREEIYKLRNLDHYGGYKAMIAKTDEEVKIPSGLPVTLSGPPTGAWEQAFAAAYLERTLPLLELPEEELVLALLAAHSSMMQSGNLSLAFYQKEALGLDSVAQMLVQPTWNQQATIILLSVLEFERRNGRWPYDLAEAGADLPDPFTGEPLHYRLEGDGFIFWSVGSNLVNDEAVGEDYWSNSMVGEDLSIQYPLTY